MPQPEISLDKIYSYISDGLNPPTPDDYENAGFSRVTYDNVDAINIYLRQNATSSSLVSELQDMINTKCDSIELVFQQPSETYTNWSFYSDTSELTGEESKYLMLDITTDIGFVIACKNGGIDLYYISTDFVTGSGHVSYRVGRQDVQTQTWNECASCGYDALFPKYNSQFELTNFALSPDIVFQVHKFSSGYKERTLNNWGFGNAVDQTRDICGWSTIDFPENNGFGKAIPTTVPADVKEANYEMNVNNQFRMVGWLDINTRGEKQLILRLGDQVGPCVNDTIYYPVRDNLLYVEQDGSETPITAESKLQESCKTPVIHVMSGDFDASRPFVLKQYTDKYKSSLSASIEFN